MCVIELIPEERWIWQCAWFWKTTVVKCWKREVAEDADIHVDTPKTVIYSTLNEQKDKKTSEEWLTEFINWYCEYVYLIHVTVLWYFWDTLKLFCNIHKLCIIIAISFKHYCISNLHSTNPLSNYFFVWNDIISHTIFFSYLYLNFLFYG